ncbi:MAG: hypothetical protein ABSG03_05890 [Bryobacteraceae bacterium]
MDPHGTGRVEVSPLPPALADSGCAGQTLSGQNTSRMRQQE